MTATTMISENVRKGFEAQREIAKFNAGVAKKAVDAQKDVYDVFASGLESVESAQKEFVGESEETVNEAVENIADFLGDFDDGRASENLEEAVDRVFDEINEAQDEGWEAVNENVERAGEAHEDALDRYTEVFEESVESLLDEHEDLEDSTVELVEEVEDRLNERLDGDEATVIEIES